MVMSTMNISLPAELKDFVDNQVKRGYGTSSEYVRELIRKDQERVRLRELLLAARALRRALPAAVEVEGSSATCQWGPRRRSDNMRCLWGNQKA
jgi:antitoxin ParD1/3/4